MLKKLFIIIFLLLTYQLISLANNPPTIAVYGFSSSLIEQEELMGINLLLEYAIFKTGYFDVYERSSLEKIFSELNLAKEGIITEDDAVKAGKLLGVRYVAFGSIEKAVKNIFLGFKIVDVSNGRIVYRYNDNVNYLSELNIDFFDKMMNDLIVVNDKIILKEFDFTLINNKINVLTGKSVELKLNLTPKYGFKGDINFCLKNVTEKNVLKYFSIIPTRVNLFSNLPELNITLKVSEETPIGEYEVYLVGKTAYTIQKKKIYITVNSIPKRPENLKVEVWNKTKIKLTWEDKSKNESGFIIERKFSDSDWIVIGSVKTNVNEFYDTEIYNFRSSRGKAYYRVRAFNEFGYSNYSNVDIIEIKFLPGKPSNFSGVFNGETVKLTWHYNFNTNHIDGFYIEKSLDNKNWKLIAKASKNNRIFEDKDISFSHETYLNYRICSYNINGKSEYLYYRVKISEPDKPTNLKIDSLGKFYVKIKWLPSLLAQGYVIERSDNYYTWKEVGRTTSTYYKDPTVSYANKYYYYRVRAYNKVGYSDYSEVLKVEWPVLPKPIVLRTEKEKRNNTYWFYFYIQSLPKTVDYIEIQVSKDNKNWTTVRTEYSSDEIVELSSKVLEERLKTSIPSWPFSKKIYFRIVFVNEFFKTYSDSLELEVSKPFFNETFLWWLPIFLLGVLLFYYLSM